MGQPRTKPPKAHETTLQTVFVKRMKQELEDRHLSVLQFSRLVGAPPERTLADVLRGGAVPRLTLIHQCATALNIPAFELLKERDRARQELPTDKVKHLPTRAHQRPIFAAHHESRTQGKTKVRNKDRG